MDSASGTPVILVLYGSQTGNAQDVAERVAREGRLRHWRMRAMPMDAFDVSRLPEERIVVFVASTTGQGECPDNMKAFWKFLLRKSLQAGSLSGVLFAAFGLGDSGYPKFNVVVKKLDRRMQQLGATPVVERGQGDDQHKLGYEGELHTWLRKLWMALQLRYPLPPALQDPAPAGEATMPLGEPKFRVTFLQAEQLPADCQQQLLHPMQEAAEAASALRRVAAVADGWAASQPPDAASTESGTGGGDSENGEHGDAPGPSRPFMARMVCNRRLTAPDHFQDVRHLELDLEGSGMRYRPGDLLVVLPQTRKEMVERFCARCGLDPEAWVRVEAASAPSAAALARVGALVQGALDVAGASPRRYFFEVLQHFSQREVEKERLQYFASAEGREDLHTYCHGERRPVVEVLEDFAHTDAPPLAWLLQIVPQLQPRHFSLSSAATATPNRAHLTVAVVDWVTPYRRRRTGLCSHWLASMDPDARDDAMVPVWMQPGTLTMPDDPATPLIMVGPGTGVAPFRSFLLDRQAASRTFLSTHAPPDACSVILPGPDHSEHTGTIAPAPTCPEAFGAVAPPEAPVRSSAAALPAPCLLFFGCRNRAGDFLYQELWQELQQQGILDRDLGVVTAFSRDQSRKVYVQQRIREHGAHVWSLLQQGAYVYISGNAKKMPAEVQDAFCTVAHMHGGLEEAAARTWLRRMELTGRLQVEAWS